MRRLILALVLTACGGSAPGSGTGANGSSGTGSGSVTLTVDKVDAPPVISGVAPSSGRGYVTTAVTLTNVGAASPIPASPIYFTLKTRAGLVLTAAPQSAALSPACPVDTSLSTGAKLACGLAFEVPTRDAPASLAYDDEHGDTASAAVATPTVNGCEQLFSWHMRTSACNDCLASASYSTGACGAQSMAFNKCQPSSYGMCSVTCGDKYSNDPASACSCNDACAAGCASQLDAYLSCLAITCSGVCS